MHNNHAEFTAALAHDPHTAVNPDGTLSYTCVIGGQITTSRPNHPQLILPFRVPVKATGYPAEILARRAYRQGDVIILRGALNYTVTHRPGDRQRRSCITIEPDTIDLLIPAASAPLIHEGPYVRYAGGENRVSLIGNVTRPAQLRHTNAGDSVRTVPCAVNDIPRAPGLPSTRQLFVDINVWRDLAEQPTGFNTSDRVAVTGPLLQDHWVGQDGQRRSVLRIEATQYQPLISAQVHAAQHTAHQRITFEYSAAQ